MNLSLPDYDESVFQGKIVEVSQYTVSIPSNVITLGYDKLSELFSKVQGFMDRVESILSEASLLNAQAKSAFEATKFNFQAKFDAMLSSENQTEYESIKILEAKIRHTLAEEQRQMQRAKLTAGLFKAYLDVVQGKYSNLIEAKRTLEAQTNLFKRMNPPLNANPSGFR